MKRYSFIYSYNNSIFLSINKNLNVKKEGEKTDDKKREYIAVMYIKENI